MRRTTATRAHGAGDKQTRRAAILRAARALFLAGDGSLPTAGDIAAEAGLAKGTTYLYFRTKEEIFAAVLLEGWSEAMAAVQKGLDGSREGRDSKVEVLLQTLTTYLYQNEWLLCLDALGYGVLEKNMQQKALLTHKAAFTERLLETGATMDVSLLLPEGRGVQLLTRTYALTRGLWQSYRHIEETLRVGVTVIPGLTPGVFEEELLEALREYWRGAL